MKFRTSNSLIRYVDNSLTNGNNRIVWIRDENKITVLGVFEYYDDSQMEEAVKYFKTIHPHWNKQKLIAHPVFRKYFKTLK